MLHGKMTSTNLIAHCEGNCVREKKKKRACSCMVDALRGNFDKVSHFAGSNVVTEYFEGMIFAGIHLSNLCTREDGFLSPLLFLPTSLHSLIPRNI